MSWREHNGHAHGAGAAGPDADTRWLAAAGVLILAFMAGEVVAGLLAHSLALLSDAAHMLTDAASGPAAPAPWACPLCSRQLISSPFSHLPV